MKNRKRIINKIHRYILKAITWLAVLGLLTSLFSLDGPYWQLAILGLVLSVGWIVLFCWANYEQWKEVFEDVK